MTVGERIQIARKRAGLSQKQLGEKMGLSASMIGQWENDLRNPKYDTSKRIAAALDVDVNWLMNGKTLEQRDQETKDKLQSRFTEAELNKRLEDSYSKLTLEGKGKAVERVEELTEIPRYQKSPQQTQQDPSPQDSEITQEDGESPPEGRTDPNKHT